MGAEGVNGKHLVAAAREQNGIISDVSREHSAVGQRIEGNARDEIGTDGVCGFGAHGKPLRP
jgi:hypothetical protein